MSNKPHKNMNTTPIELPKTGNNSQQPTFQWEAPVLYTEDWLKTYGGGITDIIESSNYHT